MSALDLHPEDLLDKDARGELSDDERRFLDAHLSRCVACRFEQKVRGDFDRELEGRDSGSWVPLLVAGAMKDEEPDAAPALPKRNALWTRRAVFLLAAALLFVSGVAAAQSEVAGKVWARVGRAFDPTPAVVAPPAATIATTATSSTSTVAAHGTPSPSAPKEVEHSAAPAETAAPIENFAPRAPAALEPKRAIVAERGAKAAPEPETPKVQPEAMAPPPAPEASAPPPETASTVFERANIARRHGDNAGAIAAYRDLQSRYPGSSEARLSIAVVARMQLDSGNPSAALAGFDAYLRTGHAMLREEAMAGRALALERLGRTADARQAWSAFVASYPRSAYARHAEKLLRDPTE